MTEEVLFPGFFVLFVFFCLGEKLSCFFGRADSAAYSAFNKQRAAGEEIEGFLYSFWGPRSKSGYFLVLVVHFVVVVVVAALLNVQKETQFCSILDAISLFPRKKCVSPIHKHTKYAYILKQKTKELYLTLVSSCDLANRLN